MFDFLVKSKVRFRFGSAQKEATLNMLGPRQIQLKIRRTGAVLTRRMDTYKEVVLTKVASNHTS